MEVAYTTGLSMETICPQRTSQGKESDWCFFLSRGEKNRKARIQEHCTEHWANIPAKSEYQIEILPSFFKNSFISSGFCTEDKHSKEPSFIPMCNPQLTS